MRYQEPPPSVPDLEAPPVAPRRVAYYWRIAAQQAEPFLLAMWPFLRTCIYRSRAVTALDFQAQKQLSPRRRNGALEEYRRRQWEFYEHMRWLNLRGRAATFTCSCPQAIEHRKAKP